jgi:hypothetical protein
MTFGNRNKRDPRNRATLEPGREAVTMGRCKACGREYNALHTMTYSAYGYCSWECLMKEKTVRKPRQRDGRKPQGGFRPVSGNRAR